jgi:predicted membrane channel-forming protein YqfA (hemolysin III family)
MKIRGGNNALITSIISSTEDLGFYMASLYLMIGIILSIGMIGIAIHLFITKGKYSQYTVADVKESVCTQDYSKEIGRTQDCTVNLSYSVDSKLYTNTLPIGNKKYQNKKIDIMYDSKNPSDIQKKNNIRNYISILLILLAIIIISAVWTRYYIIVKARVQNLI